MKTTPQVFTSTTKKKWSQLKRPEQVQFRDILKKFNRKNDLFYSLNSNEIQPHLLHIRPYKTNDFSILYLDKGTLSVKLDITTYHLKAGTIITKTPEVIFQILDHSKDCHFQIFGFTEELIHSSGIHKKHLEALSFLSFRREPFIELRGKEPETVFQLMKFFAQKGKQDSKDVYYDHSIAHAFALFIFEIASILVKDQAMALPLIKKKEHLAVHFLQLLSANAGKERTVNFYAGQLNISSKYLSKCVKEVFKKTCGQMIDDAVILEAKVLLDDPALSIAQVADQLDFSDQFFFSKFFKKNTGQSPSIYRSLL